MAQCKQSPQEFIRNAFTPQIAVLCTPLADEHCQKNNLNFIELLQPFSKLSNDVHFKDPTGSVVTVRNLNLTFMDVNTRPPQTTLARKLLNSSVSELSESPGDSFSCGDYKLDITMSTPWFEAWRDTFLKVQYPSDHEYTKHFLSCILVLSSSEINAIETTIQLSQSLNQLQNHSPGKLPKWFSSTVLRYFVIIHDNIEGNMDVAHESYEAIKNSYGEANCFLLRMNSRPPGASATDHLPDPWSQFINNNIENRDFKITPETSPFTTRALGDENATEIKTKLTYHPLSPDTEDLVLGTPVLEKDKNVANATKPKSHGVCLSTEDVEQVKLLLHEFSKTCLVPYVEKQIYQLNDVISNKKGVSRSLFSATKRWFNPNKPGASVSAVNNLIYAPDSPELQVRRLGDLYFMFGHYSLAFQAYHLAKRDYNTDQAWLYYAGALEMAALSAFMANDSNRKTCDYMEESITTYLNTCKMPQFATRATLLSSECLKSKGLYGEAAHQLIRMTSEDSDLRSALFLEQAAYCFLHSKMLRKYAFHMVLAGHRFSKATQKKHSLRSYKQAHQVYEKSGWDLAEDHINYTIGRQAHNLHSFGEAVSSFSKLLERKSKQSASQQGVFLKEYLTILGNMLLKDSSGQTPILVLPKIDSRALKLLMGPTPPLTTPGKVPAAGVTFTDDDSRDSVLKWNKLEEMLVQKAQQGQLVGIFKPMTNLYTVNNLNNKSKPVAVVNEPIQVYVQFQNVLQIVLQIRDIYLLWAFNDGTDVISNEDRTAVSENESDADRFVKTHITKSLLIEKNCVKSIVLCVTPLVTGMIILKGICYSLVSSSEIAENVVINGKQSFNLEDDGKHLEVAVEVVPLAPCLQVTFSEVNEDFLCDEVQSVSINFQNTGTLPLQKIYLASSVPNLLCNSETNSPYMPPYTDSLPPAKKEIYMRENHITSVSLPNDRLEPGSSNTTTIYVQAPSTPGPCSVDLLIYYENLDPTIQPRYRLVRHKWNLTVHESLKTEVSIQASYNSKSVEELAVVLKVTNLNKVHSSTQTEISILNVGLLSKCWSFTENIATPKFIKLFSQESAHVLLKTKRIQKKASKYTNILLTNEEIRKNFTTAYLNFAKKTEQCPLNIFNESEQELSDHPDGIVLVQWQASVSNSKNRLVNGQSQVSIQKQKDEQLEIYEFADPANLLEISLNKNTSENEKTETNVTYNLIYPAVVEHNFSRDKLCVVPVTLLLHSVISDKTVSVIINTLNVTSGPPAPSRSDIFCPCASKDFSWLGVGSCVHEMKPLTSTSVKLSVVVTNPGTFDLGAHIEVFCGATNQEAVLQSCQMQSALIVIDANS